MQPASILILLGQALAAIDYLTSTSSNTATATTSYPSLTLLVYTTAYVNGLSTAYQITYTQKFSQLYSTTATYKSGTIGLGTIQGTVGAYRSLADPRSEDAPSSASGSTDSVSGSSSDSASSTASDTGSSTTAGAASTTA